MGNLYDRVKLVVFSIHDTLVQNTKDGVALERAEDITLKPRVRPILKKLSSEGYFITGVINITEEVFGGIKSEHVINYFSTVSYLLVDCKLDEMYYSWKNGSNRWMPFPGMINDISFDYNVPKDNILFVGSSDTDWVTAQSAGIRFAYSEDFFNHLVVRIPCDFLEQ